MAAQFEIRQLRLDAARKILGMALGMCPKVGSGEVVAAKVAGSGLDACAAACSTQAAHSPPHLQPL
jgi:hypothetical protein